MSGKIRTRFFVKTVDRLHWKEKPPGRFTFNNVIAFCDPASGPVTPPDTAYDVMIFPDFLRYLCKRSDRN